MVVRREVQGNTEYATPRPRAMGRRTDPYAMSLAAVMEVASVIGASMAAGAISAIRGAGAIGTVTTDCGTSI